MTKEIHDIQSNPFPVIRIVGARTHNLQSIDVEIPIGRLTVITGVSGSGKSSLAFKTIFAEGQWRYLSSLSAQSRELLQEVERPDVDFIDGLPPVLCVEQQMSGARKRSTVATVSDIYDYLRLLFARIGRLYCPDCQEPVTAQSRSDIVNQALQCHDGQKVIVLAPIIRGRTGQLSSVFAQIVKDGFVRARVDGELVDAAAPPELTKSKPHDIDVVVDRLIMKAGVRPRLEESVDLALQLGRGQCVLSHDTSSGWQDRLYNSQLACAKCGTSFPTLEPRSFSFNSAVGACPTCLGLGIVTELDESSKICPSCAGTRLGPIPRAVQIDGTSITEFCAMSPSEATQCVLSWGELNPSLSNKGDLDQQRRSAFQHLLPEITHRLRSLTEIGLDYLTLNRSSDTLSAGELQRTRLAACLGNPLNGVCYILDEPTAGLHASDTGRLLKSLIRLRDEGNTVLLVEHDLDVIRAADHVIDLGPGAGTLGGRLIAAGTPDELAGNPASVTGPFLINEGQCRVGLIHGTESPSANNQPPANLIRLTGATLHRLKNVTIEIPLNRIVCVTGVSGSGKSSLVMQTLVPAIRRALGEKIPCGGPFLELKGTEHLSRVVRVDQTPLSRSAISTPATYSGLWDEIRKVFAKTKESRLSGFTPRQFSLHVPEARCTRCRGRGQLPVEEQRFADWQIRCPDCDGRRFSTTTLSVRYRGQSVADLLNMSLIDASDFFENLPRLARPLKVFCDLGLGYLKLGQSAATLSGGEAQRVKLGTELAKSTEADRSTLFVLDEPTAGLHMADVRQLVGVLRKLVSVGHSMLIIEHNSELIAAADWRIEIGPGAGPDGGQITFAGPQNAWRCRS
jgi:excinuclease ABC subunit A